MQALPHLLDLGCGVGGTISRVAHLVEATCTGVTISPTQAEIARRALATHRAADRLSILEGDYTSDEIWARIAAVGAVDAAWMVESFTHAPDPDALLARISATLRPGGIVVICDDLPAAELSTAIAADRTVERDWLEFVAGWHVPSAISAAQLVQVAAGHGLHLVETRDLSDWAVIDRPRDRIARLAAFVGRLTGRASPWWQNIRGGTALQALSRRKLVRYQILVLRRGHSDASA